MKSFFTRVFCDLGEPSYSRVASAVIVMATLGWVSYALVRTSQIPDLSGPSLFLSTGVGVHYGSNKLPSIVTALTKKDASETLKPSA